VVLSAAIASVWFLVIATVLIVGIEVTSRVQVVMTSIELIILTVVAIAAFVHAAHAGAVNPVSWHWVGLNYSASGFAGTALVVVYFYWGWDVTANLGEETHNGHEAAGNGGFVSIFITIIYYVAFVCAALVLFAVADAKSFNANIIYNIAVSAGLGRTGGLLASGAVILSSIATLETTMLQFSRTLFAMGRDGAMHPAFGVVDARTKTPVRAMLVLIVVGLLLLWGSSLMPTIGTIITDSVNAVGVLVAYYYGLAGFVALWVFRNEWRQSVLRWIVLALFPAFSAVVLIVLGVYAIATFDKVTDVVAIGGLIIGIVFFRPRRFVVKPPALPAP
jgi:amino acid transporter